MTREEIKTKLLHILEELGYSDIMYVDAKEEKDWDWDDLWFEDCGIDEEDHHVVCGKILPQIENLKAIKYKKSNIDEPGASFIRFYFNNAIITMPSADYSCEELVCVSMDGFGRDIDAFDYDCGKVKSDAYAVIDQLSNNNIPSDGFWIHNERLIRYSGDEKEIVIPAGVAEIGISAFSGKEIVSVSIPPSVKFIDSDAFQDSNLSSIEIPASVQQINSRAFSGCNKLKRVIISEGVIEIGFGAFIDTVIEDIEIPCSVKTMEENVFNYCKNLRRIVLPKGIDADTLCLPEDCEIIVR